MSSTKRKQTASQWDEAIREATERIVRLRTAIAVFEEMKAQGKPWPGSEQIKRQLEEQQHSV